MTGGQPAGRSIQKRPSTAGSIARGKAAVGTVGAQAARPFLPPVQLPPLSSPRQAQRQGPDHRGGGSGESAAAPAEGEGRPRSVSTRTATPTTCFPRGLVWEDDDHTGQASTGSRRSHAGEGIPRCAYRADGGWAEGSRTSLGGTSMRLTIPTPQGTWSLTDTRPTGKTQQLPPDRGRVMPNKETERRGGEGHIPSLHRQTHPVWRCWAVEDDPQVPKSTTGGRWCVDRRMQWNCFLPASDTTPPKDGEHTWAPKPTVTARSSPSRMAPHRPRTQSTRGSQKPTVTARSSPKQHSATRPRNAEHT